MGDVLGQPRVHQRRRGIGAHTARVRPPIAVENALVILCRRQRPRRLAIAQVEAGDLLAGEPLLDEDLVPRGAEEPRLHDPTDGLPRLRERIADDGALPPREAIGLHHHGGVSRGWQVVGSSNADRLRSAVAFSV